MDNMSPAWLITDVPWAVPSLLISSLRTLSPKNVSNRDYRICSSTYCVAKQNNTNSFSRFEIPINSRRIIYPIDCLCKRIRSLKSLFRIIGSDNSRFHIILDMIRAERRSIAAHMSRQRKAFSKRFVNGISTAVMCFVDDEKTRRIRDGWIRFLIRHIIPCRHRGSSRSLWHR